MSLMAFPEHQGQRGTAEEGDNWGRLAEVASKEQKDILLQVELFDPSNHTFGNPAWSIMLFLFEHLCANKRATVSDTAFASLAAPTTGLRYIEKLMKTGYIKRTPDNHDRRRSFLTLSDEAGARMRAYFDKSGKLGK